MIGKGVESLFAEPVSNILGLVAGGNRRFPHRWRFTLQEFQLLLGIVLESDAVANVWTIKASNKLFRIFQLQTADNFPTGTLVRGRSAMRGTSGNNSCKTELQVVSAKIVAPLRNTVGFIDSEKRQFSFRRAEACAPGSVAPVRYTVNPIHHCATALQSAALHPATGLNSERGLHPKQTHGVYLILHQGNQRRNHDATARARQE